VRRIDLICDGERELNGLEADKASGMLDPTWPRRWAALEEDLQGGSASAYREDDPTAAYRRQGRMVTPPMKAAGLARELEGINGACAQSSGPPRT